MWQVEMVLIWILFISLSCFLVHGRKFLFENFCPNLANTDFQQQHSSHSPPPRYFIVGARDSVDYGLGNLLAFYPACFFYSMLTARFLVIDDRSHLGKFCTILHCGVPLYSSIKAAYPEIFSSLDDRQMKTLHHQNFPQSFDSDHAVIYNDTLLTAVGMDDRSSWWVWNPITRQCIANITGCLQGDIGCAERVAFQRLLLGPFLHLERVIPWAEESIEGLSRSMRLAILTLPREYVPRFDMAVHLRNQFRYFEREMDVTHPEAKAEVTQWLNSTECHEVFERLANEVLRRFQESSAFTSTSTSRHQQPHHHHHNHHQDFMLFITADSEEVKFAFQSYLQKKLPGGRNPLRIVTIRTGGTYHVKGTERFNADGQNKRLFFLVLEWYLLTLCDNTLAWRMGGTRGTSTFVGSARKVAGTHERSNREDGRSIASRSFQLVRGKHGYVFEEFWTYGVLDPQ